MFDKNLSLKKIQQGFKIPPKPEILQEITDLMEDENFELPDVGELIAKDIGISSDVLRIVNSSANGFNRTIADISQAVCFLGAEQVKAIVGVNKLRAAYSGNSGLKLERFWDETVENATTMLYVNKWLGKKFPPDSLYTFGLFHDCGIAAMGYKYDDYLEVLLDSNENPDVDLAWAENKRYKVDHATIGFYIGASWRLPKTICKMIRVHHDFEAVQSTFNPQQKGMYAILKITEYMIRNIRRFEENRFFDEQKDELLSWVGMGDQDFDDLKDDLSDII